jgi:hypothetical protein
MSFVKMLRNHRQTALAGAGDPYSHWEGVLRKVSGTIWPDGLERVSVAALFEGLGVAPDQQTIEAAKKLREIMVCLGWSAMAAHATVARGGRGLVVGYARIVERNR